MASLRSSSRRREITSIKTQLQELADGVLDGSVQRADAAVASQILNVLLRAITLELEIKDQTEHAERISALEEKLAQREAR
jgi:predicted ATP-grasp superfamily ATP-dependent carboligase